MAQRMVAREQLVDQLLDMGADLFGLLLGVTDFEARYAKLFFWIMEIIGGELSDAPKSWVRGKALAVLAEEFDDFLRESDPDYLADVNKGDRVEVFFHLDMAVGMDFSLPPLAELEGEAGRAFNCFFSSAKRWERLTP